MSEFFDNAGVSAYPYFEGEKTNPDTINEGKVQWLIDKVMNEKDGTLTDDIKAVLKGFNPAEQELFNGNYRAINELTEDATFAGQYYGTADLPYDYDPKYSNAEYIKLFDEVDRIEAKLWNLDQKDIDPSQLKHDSVVLETLSNSLDHLENEYEIARAWYEGPEGRASRPGFEQGEMIEKYGGLIGGMASIVMKTAGTGIIGVADAVENLNWNSTDDIETFKETGWAINYFSDSAQGKSMRKEINDMRGKVNKQKNRITNTYGQNIAEDIQTLKDNKGEIARNQLVHYKYLSDSNVSKLIDDYGLQYDSSDMLYSLNNAIKSQQTTDDLDAMLDDFLTD